MYRQEDKPDIYLITGYTDFRCGINGLIKVLKNKGNIDITSNSLFIFSCKTKDKIKMLYYSGVGFWLLSYRLEKGKFKWYKNADIKSITYKQLEWLLDGLDIEQKNYQSKQGNYTYF